MITADQKSEFAELAVRADMDTAAVASKMELTKKQASDLMKDTEVRALIRRKMLAAGATAEWLSAKVTAVMDADFADFEAVQKGEKTLAQLREEGIDTTVVKQIKNNGEVILHDRDKANDQFIKLMGLDMGGKGGNTIHGDVHVHGGAMQQAMPEEASCYERIGIQADVIEEATRAGA